MKTTINALTLGISLSLATHSWADDATDYLNMAKQVVANASSSSQQAFPCLLGPKPRVTKPLFLSPLILKTAGY